MWKGNPQSMIGRGRESLDASRRKRARQTSGENSRTHGSWLWGFAGKQHVQDLRERKRKKYREREREGRLFMSFWLLKVVIIFTVYKMMLQVTHALRDRVGICTYIPMSSCSMFIVFIFFRRLKIGREIFWDWKSSVRKCSDYPSFYVCWSVLTLSEFRLAVISLA